ncbi:hypothetical protein [Candidatus Spyradosoma sp. SGI.093]|uniref:hypothetical protein n=1 Tax=Candidatus Spyradosoma sp. SGI.093 TaxID=3420583 RepID=UPI003CFD6D74
MSVPANRKRTFDELRRIDESGNEYWSARELFPVLEYSRWEKFRPLVEKAKIACETAGAKASDHFHLEVKMIDLAKGAKHEIEDFRLSRYAWLPHCAERRFVQARHSARTNVFRDPNAQTRARRRCRVQRAQRRRPAAFSAQRNAGAQQDSRRNRETRGRAHGAKENFELE